MKAVLSRKSSLRAAASNYGISKSMLERALKSGDSSRKKRGRPTAFPEEVEAELAKLLLDMADKAFSVTPDAACQLAHNVYKQLGGNDPDMKFTKSWLKGFLKRNPEVRKRTATSANEGRLTSFNRMSFATWTNIVEPLLKQYNIREIFNVDDCGYNIETGKIIVSPHACRLCTYFGFKVVYQ